MDVTFPLKTPLKIESSAAAPRERPQVYKLLVAGDFKADLEKPEGERREEEIAANLVAAVLEDMYVHFLPRRRPWCWDRRAWSIVRLGSELRSQKY